jgi:hypothetical protein
MTPDERDRVAELFDRLETLENTPRDREAERVIADGFDRAPNAAYALVQSVLVQEEAIKAADARIRELEAELGYGEPQQQQGGGFLDNMRDAIFGRDEPQQQPRRGGGLVPQVRSADAPMGTPSGFRNQQMGGDAGYGTRADQGYQQQADPRGQQAGGFLGGGSFLGTAAATAAGVIGGAMLANSLKGLFGGGGNERGQSAYDAPSERGSPWGGESSGSGGDLSREAGLNDIGRGGGASGSERYGAFDQGQGQDHGGEHETAEMDFSDDGDFGGDGGDFA